MIIIIIITVMELVHHDPCRMKCHGSPATERNLLEGEAVPKDRGREKEAFQAEEGHSKVQRPFYQQERE